MPACYLDSYIYFVIYFHTIFFLFLINEYHLLITIRFEESLRLNINFYVHSVLLFLRIKLYISAKILYIHSFVGFIRNVPCKLLQNSRLQMGIKQSPW